MNLLKQRRLLRCLGSRLMSCAKCHQAPPVESDTWCLGCISWEKLGQELCSTWRLPGFRALAADQCVSAVRAVRGLRVLGNSVESARASSAGGHREREPTDRDLRRPAHPERSPRRGRPAATPPSGHQGVATSTSARVKPELDEEYTYTSGGPRGRGRGRSPCTRGGAQERGF